MDKKSVQQMLDYLALHGTESELLDLCLNVEDRISLEKSRQKDLTGFLARVSPQKSVPPKTSSVGESSVTSTSSSSKVVSDAVVKRIRKDVVARILTHLKNGPDKPTTLANLLNMSTGKMSSIISALVGRGDIVFDGKVVSLSSSTKRS